MAEDKTSIKNLLTKLKIQGDIVIIKQPKGMDKCMKKVNAVVVSKFGGPEVLEYTSVEIPELSPTEVLIKVEAASVNFADIKARTGNYHGAGNPPFVPGLDCAGIVEAIGSGVTKLKVGQRVMTFPSTGSYADFVNAEEVVTYPIADHIDFETAAAYPTVAITSYNLLKKMANIQEGETVLIHSASGGIGTTATQIAKLLGAKTVIGTVGSDEKKHVAKQAGVDHVINYQTEQFVQIVNDLTNGQGVDIILDSLAGDIFEQSLECLARFGRIVNFGNAHATEAGKVNTMALHSTCRSVLGYSTGTYKKYRPEELKDAAKNVISYLENGKVNMFISKRFKLSEAGEAQKHIEDRKSTGKVILLPN